MEQTNPHPHPQNIIALISDLDLTLTPEYTQTPLLKKFGINPDDFWKYVNTRYALEKAQRKKELGEEEKKFPLELRVSPDQHRADFTQELIYTNVILEYIRKGIFNGLSRNLLRETGKEIKFFPGVPDFIPQLKNWVLENPVWKRHDIKLEFYIVSSGIADMIRGSKIMPFCDGIFATEFGTGDNDRVEGQVDRIDFSVSYTEKTRFIHMISKGFDVDVNDPLPHNMRRVRGDCMIFMGDGPTDVPSMSTVKSFGGKSIAVYGLYGDPVKDKKAFENALKLRQQHRVLSFSEADFTPESQTIRTLKYLISEAADRIVKDRDAAIEAFSGRSPKIH